MVVTINAAKGSNWQATVKQMLEKEYPSSEYTIIENTSLKNTNDQTIYINGKYVRPDFLVYDNASGRLAVVGEAKTGNLTYLSGRGQDKLYVYKDYIDQSGYDDVELRAYYALDEPSAAADGDVLGTIADTAGKVVGPLILLDIIINAVRNTQQQQQLDWLRQYDPDYYLQITAPSEITGPA